MNGMTGVGRYGKALLLVALPLLLSATALAEAPQKNYRLYCMGCHRLDGSGSPEVGIPSMKGEVGHFLRLAEGRAYLSQVPGTLNTPLSDKETADLLNWMVVAIGKDSVPANFVPYSGEDVARYRAAIPADIPALREKLMKRLAAGEGS